MCVCVLQINDCSTTYADEVAYKLYYTDTINKFNYGISIQKYVLSARLSMLISCNVGHVNHAHEPHLPCSCPPGQSSALGCGVPPRG